MKSYRYPWKIKEPDREKMSELAKTRHALERDRAYLDGVGLLLSTLPGYMSASPGAALFQLGPEQRVVQIKWDSSGAYIPGTGTVKKGRDILNAMSKLAAEDYD